MERKEQHMAKRISKMNKNPNYIYTFIATKPIDSDGVLQGDDMIR